VIAFFGDAIRWSYRRSPSVFPKPDDQRTQNGVSRIASRPELTGP